MLYPIGSSNRSSRRNASACAAKNAVAASSARHTVVSRSRSSAGSSIQRTLLCAARRASHVTAITAMHETVAAQPSMAITVASSGIISSCVEKLELAWPPPTPITPTPFDRNATLTAPSTATYNDNTESAMRYTKLGSARKTPTTAAATSNDSTGMRSLRSASALPSSAWCGESGSAAKNSRAIRSLRAARPAWAMV